MTIRTVIAALMLALVGCAEPLPYSPPIVSEAELKPNVGKPVTIIGIASNSLKAGPAVLLDDYPIYLNALDQFPDNVAGKKIQVLGKLKWIAETPPEKGELPRAQLGNHYQLIDHRWVMIEPITKK